MLPNCILNYTILYLEVLTRHTLNSNPGSATAYAYYTKDRKDIWIRVDVYQVNVHPLKTIFRWIYSLIPS